MNVLNFWTILLSTSLFLKTACASEEVTEIQAQLVQNYSNSDQMMMDTTNQDRLYIEENFIQRLLNVKPSESKYNKDDNLVNHQGGESMNNKYFTMSDPKKDYVNIEGPNVVHEKAHKLPIVHVSRDGTTAIYDSYKSRAAGMNEKLDSYNLVTNQSGSKESSFISEASTVNNQTVSNDSSKSDTKEDAGLTSNTVNENIYKSASLMMDSKFNEQSPKLDKIAKTFHRSSLSQPLLAFNQPFSAIPWRIPLYYPLRPFSPTFSRNDQFLQLPLSTTNSYASIFRPQAYYSPTTGVFSTSYFIPPTAIQFSNTVGPTTFGNVLADPYYNLYSSNSQLENFLDFKPQYNRYPIDNMHSGSYSSSIYKSHSSKDVKMKDMVKSMMFKIRPLTGYANKMYKDLKTKLKGFASSKSDTFKFDTGSIVHDPGDLRLSPLELERLLLANMVSEKIKRMGKYKSRLPFELDNTLNKTQSSQDDEEEEEDMYTSYQTFHPVLHKGNNKTHSNSTYFKSKISQQSMDKSSLYIYPPSSKLPESIKLVPAAASSLEQGKVLQLDASQSLKSPFITSVADETKFSSENVKNYETFQSFLDKLKTIESNFKKINQGDQEAQQTNQSSMAQLANHLLHSNENKDKPFGDTFYSSSPLLHNYSNNSDYMVHLNGNHHLPNYSTYSSSTAAPYANPFMVDQISSSFKGTATKLFNRLVSFLKWPTKRSKEINWSKLNQTLLDQLDAALISNILFNIKWPNSSKVIWYNHNDLAKIFSGTKVNPHANVLYSPEMLRKVLSRYTTSELKSIILQVLNDNLAHLAHLAHHQLPDLAKPSYIKLSLPDSNDSLVNDNQFQGANTSSTLDLSTPKPKYGAQQADTDQSRFTHSSQSGDKYLALEDIYKMYKAAQALKSKAIQGETKADDWNLVYFGNKPTQKLLNRPGAVAGSMWLPTA